MGVRVTPEKFAVIKAQADRFNLPVSWWVMAVLNQVLEQKQVNEIRLP